MKNKPYLAEIITYPIKSTKGINQSKTWVEMQGIAFDRRFMVARENGAMITARDYPKLLNVTSSITPDGLNLSYPDCDNLGLRYSDFTMYETETHVFKDVFDAYTTTLQANEWFSSILGINVQLLYTGEQSKRTRQAIPRNISFADGYPLLVLSEASISALNERSIEQFSTSHFRPNLVIKGTNPFDEDGWKRIKIGEVIFEGIKPCTRCVLTTIDMKSSSFDARNEPLRTLSEFRSDKEGNVKFGHNLVALNEGTIKVGDVIEVLEEKKKEEFKPRKSEELILICVNRESVARDFCTFWFKSHNDEKLPAYFPGQHIPITIKINGKYYTRRYTLSSTPSRPGLYAISIKRTAGGIVSNWMHEKFHVGSKLVVDMPTGEFYIDHTCDKILLLAAGSGITPMISILRYLYDKKLDNDVYLFYQCRTREDVAFKLELDHLQTVNPKLKVIIALSQPDETCGAEKKRLDIMTLQGIPELTSRHVYVCGPDAFMKYAKHELLNLGLPDSHYRQEAFGFNFDTQTDLEPVTIKVNETSFAGSNQQSLLIQAEQAGVLLPYGCRAGFCGQCRVKLISGCIEQKNVRLMPSEKNQDNFVLTCCSIPLTDVEIKTEGSGN